MFDRLAFLQTVIFVLIISLLAASMGIYVLSDPGIKDAFLLARAATDIRDNFAGKYDEKLMMKHARQAMLKPLDRFSGYMDKSSFATLHEEMSGAYGGLGIMVAEDSLGLMVVSVRENSPASRAGLHTGDLITAADSVQLKDISSLESGRLLRGEEGTKVTLTVLPADGGEAEQVTVTRERIPLLHIPFAGFTPDSTIYIRLLDFEAGASADVRAALDSLYTDKTKANTKGLILDLRSNPGGLFYEARQTANLFLDKGTQIVGTSGRSHWEDEKYYASGPDITDGIPMAILVDRGSASSSEILSGALQQAGRAILVGDTTFGKGLVQGFVRFPDGDGLRLTVSRYYVGDSLYLNQFDSVLNEIGQGLPPDFYYKSEERTPIIFDLERSLLLYRFSELHRDEILVADSGSKEEAALFSKFVEYAGSNGFIYRSPVTDEIGTMKQVAQLTKATGGVEQQIDRLEKKSKSLDDKTLTNTRDYIIRRLRQLAVQSKSGQYAAYRDVVVKEQPIIHYASSLLERGEK